MQFWLLLLLVDVCDDDEGCDCLSVSAAFCTPTMHGCFNKISDAFTFNRCGTAAKKGEEEDVGEIRRRISREESG